MNFNNQQKHKSVFDIISGIHNIIIEKSNVVLTNNINEFNTLSGLPSADCSYILGMDNSVIEDTTLSSQLSGTCFNVIAVNNTFVNLKDLEKYSTKSKNNSFVNFPTPKYLDYDDSTGGQLFGDLGSQEMQYQINPFMRLEFYFR
jgi:hypothetical protein